MSAARHMSTAPGPSHARVLPIESAVGSTLDGLAPALAAAGLRVDSIEPERLMRCPVDGDRRGQTSGAYRLFTDGRPAAPWWNWKAGTSGVWVADGPPLTPAQQQHQRQRIAQAQRERQHEQARQWQAQLPKLIHQWNAAQPLTEHCAAGIYLARRGLPVPVGDALPLRFVPQLDYWDGPERVGGYPALLAAVTDPTGALVALHRTYLTEDGHKAPLPTAKKLTRTAGPLAGSAIKVWPPLLRDGALVLGLAEGIETALAASVLAGIPVWPCVSAHGLASFEPPAGVQRIYVFADHDASGAGQRAAERLAQRAARMGLVARTLTPPSPGTDWADELIARRATT
ncbi:Uncharacterized domain associated with phage/plasmid primase [Oryzisolibacter propanilivorax]|uniref:Uncharacterized domain associated with phage/plasmid primase n=1 Tax=Oryzisolibacter propanilivorax TaxID=1527607 RepID=A0A1G9TYQ3_9BURK|nr:toprim domain-containing protein [Oryzisolibacter propanilivorax]SDM52802.1 Uncharacterized domain associated with phage/plasmid primase [Oryzisolibacter propanilivorax]